MGAGGVVKIFTPNTPPKDAQPVGGDAAGAEPDAMRELFSAVASFSVPSGVMGIDVSRKAIIRKGEKVPLRATDCH
jgi:hypothetical protein